MKYYSLKKKLACCKILDFFRFSLGIINEKEDRDAMSGSLSNVFYHTITQLIVKLLFDPGIKKYFMKLVTQELENI